MGAGDSDALAGREMLRVRNGRGDAVTVLDAIVVYVWGSRGVLRATQDGLDELRAVDAQCVALHSGTADLLANLEPAAKVVREGLPGVRLWVGLGIDGTIDAYRAGKLNAQQVIARYTQVARLCQRLGAEVLVLNGESKWAIERGDVRTRDDIRALADQLGRAIRVEAPDVVLALSSFGRLGYHANVRPLIEGLTPHCSFFTGQSYAARPGPVRPGLLPAVIAADERSQEATERQGWHRDDTSESGEDDSHDDLDRVPTVQAHKTAPLDLARLLVERPFVLVWSVPTIAEGGRADAAGLEAMRVAATIRRYAPPRVANFQRANGLKADGVLGPITYARALARAT
jgi:hypothetical protein